MGWMPHLDVSEIMKTPFIIFILLATIIGASADQLDYSKIDTIVISSYLPSDGFGIPNVILKKSEVKPENTSAQAVFFLTNDKWNYIVPKLIEKIRFFKSNEPTSTVPLMTIVGTGETFDTGKIYLTDQQMSDAILGLLEELEPALDLGDANLRIALLHQLSYLNESARRFRNEQLRTSRVTQ